MNESSSKSRAHCRALDDYHEFFILGLVFQSPTIYLHELRHSSEQATNTEVSIPTICCLLRRYGLTREKIQRVALQRSSILRAAFIANMFLYKHNALVWLDETGSDKRNFLRKYGYAMRGERAVKHSFISRGKQINAIVAILSSGDWCCCASSD